jgi:hypothetical protein
MIKHFIWAAALALCACGQNSNDNVMREIDRADKADAVAVAAAQASAAQAALANAPFWRGCAPSAGSWLCHRVCCWSSNTGATHVRRAQAPMLRCWSTTKAD